MFIVEPKSKSYLESIELEVKEIISSGQNSRARELAASTKQEFYFDRYPKYFQGNLKAKVVFVNLNEREKNGINEKKSWASFERYLENCQEKLNRKYILEKGSLLEVKQLKFLDSFAKDYGRDILDRLYLYLIPYGVKNLSLREFTPKILQPFVEKTLDIITEHPRDYIIFNGSVFEQILKPYLIKKQDLEIKSDRGNKLKFSCLQLVVKQKKIKVGLAHSWNSLSMSTLDYGQHCKQLYDRA